MALKTQDIYETDRLHDFFLLSRTGQNCQVSRASSIHYSVTVYCPPAQKTNYYYYITVSPYTLKSSNFRIIIQVDFIRRLSGFPQSFESCFHFHF
jgi:hypothetical protein